MVAREKRFHPVRIYYFEDFLGEILELDYSGPNTEKSSHFLALLSSQAKIGAKSNASFAAFQFGLNTKDFVDIAYLKMVLSTESQMHLYQPQNRVHSEKGLWFMIGKKSILLLFLIILIYSYLKNI